MKIIALSCSPSKGRSSDTMLDNFIAGANEFSDIKVEKIYLKDIKMEDYSYENRKGPLKKEKEFASLVRKLKKANGLVIATPTYNFSVPAHLKNFIDRIRSIALDLDDRNWLDQPVGKLDYLRCYFLVSGGTPSWAQKLLFFAFPPFWLRGVFLYFGAHVMGAYYSGDVEAFENKRVLRKCFRLGRRYAHRVAKGKRHGLLERIFFRPPQIK